MTSNVLRTMLVGSLAVVLGCAQGPAAEELLADSCTGATADALSNGGYAAMTNAAGASLGSISVFTIRGKTTVTGNLRGLTPGFHALHIHGAGHCTPDFGHTGGHWNPAGVAHGNHKGDLPSIVASADGTATFAFVTDRFTADELFDADGSAFIIHGSPDNFGNIPTRYVAADGIAGPDAATRATGDAGARVGCGEIVR